MNKIQIPAQSGWTRYKQQTEIDPGWYFDLAVRNPPNELKRSLGMIAASDPRGRFHWLCLAEQWVADLLSGGRVRFDLRAVQPLEPNWDQIGIDPAKLRTWQRRCIVEAWTTLAHGHAYRQGWIISLGGGKTLAGLCLAQLFDHPLVLVDRYLHETWRSESKKWGLKCPDISTYESAHKYRPDALIIDEILRVKNPDAQRSERIRNLARTAELTVGFTGIATGGKGPMDFRWLRCVDPECIPAPDTCFQFLFGAEVELVEVKPGTKAYQVKSWNRPKIEAWVAPYITTIDTSSLVADLPEIEHRFIDCPTPNQYPVIVGGGGTVRGKMKQLAQARQSTDGFIYDDDEKPIRLNEMKGKMDLVEDFIENLGEPILIYSCWSEGVKILCERLAPYFPAVVDGSTTDPDAQIARFKSGQTSVLIANSRFSRGMNLQEVCRVVGFLSVSSLPDDYEQALGRVYRPGQTKGCIAVYFVCDGTLDRRAVELVQAHKGVSEAFIDGLLLAELEKE